MSVKPTILRVFLASPGDVAEERQVARDVAERINRTPGRRLGVYVDLLGWEDTLPGAARPQELINRDVLQSDVFVGLLWKRWGTETGTHSSGFEEEFELAMERRLSGSKPEVMFFFKEVDNDTLADPGPQRKAISANRLMTLPELRASAGPPQQ